MSERRKTGRAALYVMTAFALVSGFDYFRRYLKELLLRERRVSATLAAVPPPEDRLEDGAA